MSSLCPRALRLSVPVLLLASVTAQWRPVPIGSSLPSTVIPSLTVMPSGDLFFYGGLNANDWLWSGTEWSPTATPMPRRQGQAIARDTDTGDVVMFGGVMGGTSLVDTWRFNGNSWSQVITPNTPTPVIVMDMSYDPATGDMVLVGSSSLTQWETWRFDGSDWSWVSTAPLFTSNWVSMYTDTIRGTVGLFNFTTTGLEVLELENGEWQTRATWTGTVGYGNAAFDERRGRAVFFAGWPSTSGAVWEFDGLNLQQIPGSGIATSLLALDLAYDARRGEVILADTLGRVWSWSPEPAPFATAFGDPCQMSQVRLGLAPGDVPTIGATHRLQAPAMPGLVAIGMLGFSHLAHGGVPLPQPIPGSTCLQRVESLALVLMLGNPASFPITVPNASAFLGLRYDSQFLYANAAGVLEATNGLEVQIGLPVTEMALTETFASNVARDPDASGDQWAGGFVTPGVIGGDGRHGSFDPSHGTATAPNTWLWDTDNTVISASSTLSGVSETVSDGKYYFTDFVVPAGVTVNFTGSAPAQFFVRGRVEIAGALRCNGATMTTFDGRGGTALGVFVNGQPGGVAGPGGGFGGNGGDECQGTGPIIQGGIVLTDGQSGEDLQLAAGHAYAANAINTGGRGSAMNPPTGIASPNIPLVGFVYRAFFAPGGGGGGFSGPGGLASVTPLANLQVGPAPAGGVSFNLFPLQTSSSLDHFTVGGAGGGGGATHAFGTIYVTGDVYIAGAGGSGGGGACAIRSGGPMSVTSTGVLEAKGGAGAVIDGRDPNGPASSTLWGVASPGGGGSGGSFLLQSAATMQVFGAIDTSGGGGSSTGNIVPTSINVQSQAGAGAPGFYRLETPSGFVSFSAVGVPAYNAALNQGTLTDTDDLTGSRSVWLHPATLDLPVYVRYELVADINGSTVLFSDDPAVSTVAAGDPNGAVYLRFQGAQVDPITGQIMPGTAGPWRTRVIAGPGTLNSDRAEALRFDLVLDKSVGSLQVRELRVIWR